MKKILLPMLVLSSFAYGGRIKNTIEEHHDNLKQKYMKKQEQVHGPFFTHLCFCKELRISMMQKSSYWNDHNSDFYDAEYELKYELKKEDKCAAYQLWKKIAQTAEKTCSEKLIIEINELEEYLKSNPKFSV